MHCGANVPKVAPMRLGNADVSSVQRPGDYEWVLWTTLPDGRTQILRSIFAPTIHEARAHWGPQREDRAISSLISFQTMTPLPKPPREDFDGTGKVEVRISGGTFHKPTHNKPMTLRKAFAGTRSDRATDGKPRTSKPRVKKGFNARTADKRRSA